MRTYVRFVTAPIDKRSGRRGGILQAAGELERSKKLHDFELQELLTLCKWFNENLNQPDRFSWSSKSNAAEKAISWFKSSATKYVSRMHALCRVLNEHGIHTEMIKTARPGYIVYEDDHQVAAIPFAETNT
jgi:hypothetical protein